MPRLLAACLAFAAALPAWAVQADTLALKPGLYLPGSAKDAAAARPDCSDPAALSWTGHGFVGDYIYLDRVVKVESLGAGVFRLTAQTRTSDENTKKDGKTWYAQVKPLGGGAILLKQYSLHEQPAAEKFSPYAFCK